MAAVGFPKPEAVLSQPWIEISHRNLARGSTFLNLHPEVHLRLYGRHLEKSIWRHNSAVNRPITTKFSTQMQNDMTMSTHTSKSKPEVEFQYSVSPFSETGLSFISAVDWDISSKFGMQIEFHIHKQMPSISLNPKVDFSLYGRHLEKSIWRHNSAVNRPITTKFGRKMENEMPMTTHTSKAKPETVCDFLLVI